MSIKSQNINFSLQEDCKEDSDESLVTYEDLVKDLVTYEDLVKEVDLMEMSSLIGMDDYIASEVDYQTNYLKKDLERIADYYEISKRKKRKDQLVEDIVIFEKDPANIEVVFRRKKLWSYVQEIKDDKYLSKFLILD
jgi:hypothetical protein